MRGQLLSCANLLGLLKADMGDWLDDDELDPHIIEKIDSLMSERWQARQVQDWAKADEIRDTLAHAGVVIKENKDGSYTRELSENFDPAKLEGFL